MKTYTLSSDSPRWWWPTGLAGAAATAAVTALFVLAAGTVSTATPADQTKPSGQGSRGTPCFMTPANWPVRELGPVPRCFHQYGPADAAPLPRPAPTNLGTEPARGTPCFMTPANWPVRELGPVPRCFHQYGATAP